MKTGGASLGVQLRRQFGPRVYPDPNIDGESMWAYSTPSMLIERWPARRDQVNLISGHFPPCVIGLLGDHFTTFTLLRDPVERTLSFLRQRSTTDARFSGSTLEQVYDDPAIRRHRLVNNHVVSTFSVTPADMHIGLASYTLYRGGVIGGEDLRFPIDCNRDDLSRAKETLAAIDVVGLQERFDDFVAELIRRFRWRLGDPVHHNQTERVPTSETFRQRIAEDNVLDIELFNSRDPARAATGVNRAIAAGKASDGSDDLAVPLDDVNELGFQLSDPACDAGGRDLGHRRRVGIADHAHQDRGNGRTDFRSVSPLSRVREHRTCWAFPRKLVKGLARYSEIPPRCNKWSFSTYRTHLPSS